jgi:uncharacterized protein
MTLLHRRGLMIAAVVTTATAFTQARGHDVTDEAPGALTQSADHADGAAAAETVTAAPATPAPAAAAALPGATAPTPSAPPPTVPAAPGLPRWQRYAVARPRDVDRPAITIVVDDLGVMHSATERVVAMKGPLTLSWFPFARNLPAQVAAAAARGHEMTLHMPMQSFGNSIAWTGPDPLRVDLSDAVNLARLRTAIDAVPATVGLNNHMGSVATRDAALMALVARECKAHDMLFLDSVVVPHSFGYGAAHDLGVPAAARDVFIDHSLDPQLIREQLVQIEVQARRHGNAIAIGHPWPHTIAALEEWLPTLEAKGFSLWPLSAMVARRNDIKMPGNLTV